MSVVHRFVFDANLFNGTATEALDVIDFTWSMDMDRVPAIQGTMTVDDPGDTIWNQMDPRPRDPGAVILYKVYRYSSDIGGDETRQDFPPNPGIGGKLWITSATRNLTMGTITLELESGESKLEEYRNSTTAALATGAGSVRALIDYVLNAAGEPSLYSYDSVVSSTTLPAGTRRDWEPGDTGNDVIEPELDAINCRLWFTPIGLWTAGSRNTPPPSPTSTVNLKDGSNGTVIEATHGRTREGEFYDSSLIRYQYTPAGGTETIAYYASSSTGAPRAKTRFTTVERPRPSNDPTDAQAARDKKRGENVVVTCAIALDVWPGATLNLTVGGRTYTGLSIRAVTYNPADGTMEIGAQT
ncbi:MAG: hypothetical protein ABWY36_06250 [Leifsonia sp.]